MLIDFWNTDHLGKRNTCHCCTKAHSLHWSKKTHMFEELRRLNKRQVILMTDNSLLVFKRLLLLISLSSSSRFRCSTYLWYCHPHWWFGKALHWSQIAKAQLLLYWGLSFDLREWYYYETCLVLTHNHSLLPVEVWNQLSTAVISYFSPTQPRNPSRLAIYVFSRYHIEIFQLFIESSSFMTSKFFWCLMINWAFLTFLGPW